MTTFVETDDIAETGPTSDGDGKFLRIDVPAYQATSQWQSPAGQAPRSYLRLGAVPQSGWTQEPGKEFAELFGGEADGFIDDERDRGAGGGSAHAPGHQLPPDQRKLLTSGMHTEGGWRDHTDGNRISTTRGDKLEVIGGNHRLIVLGRAKLADVGGEAGDLIDQAAGLDFSGGVALVPDCTPGGAYEERWNPSVWEDGTWSMTEVEQKGDLCELAWGNRKSFSFADTIEEYVGWGPGAPAPPGGANSEMRKGGFADGANMPTIQSGTWAKAITETTQVAGAVASTTEIGAAKIENEIVGGLVSSTTTIGGAVAEKLSVVGAVASHTSVGAAMLEHTEVLGVKADHTMVALGSFSATEIGAYSDSHEHVAGAKSELTTASIASSVNVAGVAMNTDMLGTELALTVAGAKIAIDAVGADIGLSVGVKLGLHMGVDEDITLPEEKETKLSIEEKAVSVTLSNVEFKLTTVSATVTAATYTVTGASIKLG